ncbi:MAG: mechanosensitive ion channel protein MscS, partial [Thiobacillus sp. GWE1_62_9]
MDEQLQTLEHAQRTAIDLAIQFGPRLVVALLILVAGYFVGRWVGRVADSMLARLHLDETLRLLLVRIVRILVLGLFLIMALQNLGVQLLPLLAGLGVAGAGIALAMQGVLGNLAAGLTIIFTRPFQMGEYISIAGEEGVVEDIKLFNTVLSHPDRSRIVIPNRKIVGEILHNFGALRQLDVVVGVAYDTDIRQALAAIRELLAAHPKILQTPEPVIRVLALADSSVNIAIRPWAAVADFNAASSDITQAVLETFRERGI